MVGLKRLVISTYLRSWSIIFFLLKIYIFKWPSMAASEIKECLCNPTKYLFMRQTCFQISNSSKNFIWLVLSVLTDCYIATVITYGHKIRSRKVSDDASGSADTHVANEREKPSEDRTRMCRHSRTPVWILWQSLKSYCVNTAVTFNLVFKQWVAILEVISHIRTNNFIFFNSIYKFTYIITPLTKYLREKKQQKTLRR